MHKNEYDEIHESDLMFDINVQYRFGSDVHHISNFDLKDKPKVIKVISKLPHTFIDDALVGDGSSNDKSMIGVYTSDHKEITDFWLMIK